MSDERQDTIRSFGLGEDDLDAWRTSGLTDDDFEHWLTDRVARRPTGARAREVYGAEDVHDFARRALLEALRPGRGDRLLDIGCGGGLLLRGAMAGGAAAVGLDHSPEMVRLARERASGASLVRATAGALPFADGSFEAVTMSVVFFFLDDPVGVLGECRRVLVPGGRVGVYTTAPELRGTPAAPEPIASQGHFYSDDELRDLAAAAGFADLVVESEGGGQLLIATKSSA